jgi:cellulose synthase/poly-beta-1,6-N-acetylglucosamine synthase-like glycosyltransferase
MKAESDIIDVILNIILLPLYLFGLLMQFLCLAISPFILLTAMYSIPIDILLFPFVKNKWTATKWVYQDLFMLIWDSTIRDIREILEEMEK